MKSVIHTFRVILTLLFTGASFVEANFIGTLGGFLDLMLALFDATDNFKNLFITKVMLSNAFENASGCDSSDSKETLLKTVNYDEHTYESKFALDLASMDKGIENDHESFMPGDLVNLINSSRDVANAYNSFAGSIRNLVSNEDHKSFDVVCKLTDAQADLVKSLVQFSAALSSIKGPSKVSLRLSTALSAYDNAVHHSIASLKAEKKARNAEKTRNNYSRELPTELKWRATRLHNRQMSVPS